MKNITQIKNEFFSSELLGRADLMNILGGRRRHKNKNHRPTDFTSVPVSYLLSESDTTTSAVEDDKRRARPGGGTTTTSPSSFV
jgi:hypothetical protein